MSIQRATIQSGNNTISAYQRDGLFQQAQPIEGTVLFTNRESFTTERKIDFSSLQFPIKPLTMWATFGNDVVSPTITFRVKDNQTDTVIFSIVINAFPYTFPYLVVRPGTDITIQPSGALDNIWLYAAPVDVIDILRI